MIIADTSDVLALFNRTEPANRDVQRVVDETTEPLVVSPYVVAELDIWSARVSASTPSWRCSRS